MKNRRSFYLSLVFCGALITAPFGNSRAENPQVNYGAPRDLDFSPTAEAGRAVFGRVFGVQDQGGDIDYYEVEVIDHNRTNAGVRSALVPGWGQLFNGQTKKAALFFGTFVGAVAGSWSLYNKSNETYDQYNAEGIKDSSKYHDYENYRTNSLVLGAAAAIIWAYAIFDAAHEAYKGDWAKNNSFDICLDDTSSRVMYRRRF